MRRITYNKLIRDKIPDVMRRKGAAYKVTTLSKSKFKHELLLKVGEEASSLPSLKKKNDIASEIADVLDVIAQIKQTFRISDSDIREEQRKAMARKGGFRKRLFLHWSQDNGYRTNERTNRKR